MKTPEATLTQWADDRIVLDGGKGYRIWTRKGIKIIAYCLREVDFSMKPQGIRDGGFFLRSPMWYQAFDMEDKKFESVTSVLLELRNKGVIRKINALWVARFETWVELTDSLKGLFWQ